MIIFFLVFALFSTNPEGALIDSSSTLECRCDAVKIYLRDNATNSHFGTRARNNIIVSCLATILAYTWTTIHPNISAPGKYGWSQLKQRVVTWIYALLASEAITAWAMRQYFIAQLIANVYNTTYRNKISISVGFEYERQWTHSLIENPLKECTLMEKIRKYAHEWMHGSPVPEGLDAGEMRPWTITHGIFVQMGGFMRCEKGKPVSCYRYYFDLEDDINEERIDAPTTTESEIQDCSKGDVLSKTIVILQKTWFIAQCIACWSAHLPVTELEVVTLGFVILNALTYGFWWHQPQSIGVPVFLETHMLVMDEGKSTVGERKGEAGGQSGQYMVPVDGDVSEREVSRREGACAAEGTREHSTAVAVESEAGEIVAEGTNIGWRTMWERLKGFWRNLRTKHTAEVPRKEVPIEQRNFFVRQLARDRKDYPWWQLVWRTPYVLVLAVLRPLANLLEFTYTDGQKCDLHTPMFNTSGGDNETVFAASSINCFPFWIGPLHSCLVP